MPPCEEKKYNKFKSIFFPILGISFVFWAFGFLSVQNFKFYLFIGVPITILMIIVLALAQKNNEIK